MKDIMVNRHCYRWHIMLGLFLLLGGMSALKVYSLHTSYYDLGLYENTIWKIANGDWAATFTSHLSFVLIPFSWIYSLLPSSLTLVLVQSLLLSLPVLIIPVQKREFAWLVCLAYALYFPVWYNALFDFHPDSAAVPIFMAFYFYCARKQYRRAALAALLLCCVKETFALSAAFCGLFLMLEGRRTLGVLVAVASSLYFYLALEVIAPLAMGTTQAVTSSGFQWLGGSLSEVFSNLLAHPGLALETLVTPPEKILYVVLIFGAFAGIPLLAFKTLVPALPSLVLSLLSTSGNHFGYGHQYTAGLIAPLVVGFSYGLPNCLALLERLRLNKKMATRLVLASLWVGHILISPSPVSRITLSDKTWGYSLDAYAPFERTTTIRNALKNHIPGTHEASVCTINTLHDSHLAQRLKYKTLSLKSEPDADFIVYDVRRPWFLDDKGSTLRKKTPFTPKKSIQEMLGVELTDGPLSWGGSDNSSEAAFTQKIASMRKHYHTIFQVDGFVILTKDTASYSHE